MTFQEKNKQPPFFTVGLIAVVCAQFLSAFADCALVFAAMGLLIKNNYPDWSLSLLQMFFVGTYIIFAPFVGKIADHFPKGQVMMFSNLLKLVGALFICIGSDPFFGYTLVGLGAAAYSPAKYGILSEMVTKDQLVKANGLIESSTIIAILTGSLAGSLIADQSITQALALCCVVYLAAVIANFFIPKLPPAIRYHNWHILKLITSFARIVISGMRDKKIRMSLLGTGIFWGTGITLRSLMLLWVPIAFGLTDISTPAQLTAVVSVGIVIGAAIASRFITLHNVMLAIPAGALMGVIVIGLMLQNSMPLSYAILILAGTCGGFLLIPLNTLLQDQGKQTIGTGSAIALQNFCENLSMLVMLGAFTLAVKLGVNVITIGVILGAVLIVVLSSLWFWQKRAIKDW